MATEKEQLIEELRESQESREEIVVEHLDSSIALQIKVLRQQRGWSQVELGESAGLGQSQVSTLENVNNSSWTVATLKKIAAAFDLPLLVKFGSWGEFVNDVTSMSRQTMERPSFHEDPGLAIVTETQAADDSRVLSFPIKYVVGNRSQVQRLEAQGR